MSIVSLARRLRHGKLRRFNWLWNKLRPLQRRAVKLMPGRTVVQRIGPYGPFSLDSFFAFSDFEHWGGGHNNGFVATIEACRDKRCVLDVGGHIGLVAMPASQVVDAGGKVYAFEPGTANLRYLRRHLELNHIDNVEVVDALVGDQHGDTVFFEQAGPTGQNSVVVKKNHDLYSQTTRRQITLDAFCDKRALAPDVVKIDVEGAEIMVLRGARQMLARCLPTIFLSVHPHELTLLGSSTAELSELIDQIGYHCQEIDGSPVQSFRLAEYRLVPKEADTHAH
jgi:FkbM family methyltransferase